MNQKPIQTPVWLESLVMTSIVVAVAAWRFGATIVDRDLWGRLRFGLDRLEAGQYLYADPYSYLSEGQTWYDHDWLMANFMALTYRWMGPGGLVALKAALALGLVALLCWWLIRSKVPPLRMAIVMLVGVAALTPTLTTFRPQVVTTVLFAFVLIVISYVHEGHSWLVWVIPPLFALWVNLHGGVLAGIGLVGIWAVLYSVFDSGDRRFQPLFAWLVGILALGLNPHGFSHVDFLLRTTLVDRPEILDWLPIEILSPQGLAYLVLTGIVVVAVVSSKRQRVWPLLVPLGLLVIAPLSATRHLQLFVPGVMILGAPYLAELLGPGSSESSSPGSKASVGLALGIVAIASAVTIGVVASGISCLRVDADQFDFPTRAVHAIPLGTEGNAAVPFNWGEYVIWYRATDLQVSTDGRRETAYNDETHRMNLDFVNGEGDWNRLLHAAPTDLVLLPTRSPGEVLMRSEPGWNRVYDDGFASIFLPEGSGIQLAADESQPIDGEGVCFPGP